MNRVLTKRESVLLVILVILLVSIGYFKLFLEPLNSQIDSLNSKIMDGQTEIQKNAVISARIAKMEKQTAEIKGSEGYKELPKYDNGHAVTGELYEILGKTDNYEFSFGEVVMSDYIAEKPIRLEFETTTYEEAVEIIGDFSDSQFVVDIGSINIHRLSGKSADGKTAYQTKVDVTYFEAVE